MSKPIMIERRYGTSNRDWLCGFTTTETVWTLGTNALVFDDLRSARRALGRIRAQSSLWQLPSSFSFHVIKDRRHLPSHLASEEIAPRTRAGSWNDFERRFRPIIRDDDSLLWEWPDLPLPHDMRRLWTVLDCDSRLYVSPGLHYVNRLAFIRTEQPWSDLDALQDWRYD